MTKKEGTAPRTSARTAPAGQELTRAQIAQWFGVAEQTVAKWIVGQKQPKGEIRTPAFILIAETLGIDYSPSQSTVPRVIVEAFGKAVGYLDEENNVLAAGQGKRGTWLPAKPTIDPLPDKDGKPRKRWYRDHVADELGLSVNTVAGLPSRDPQFPRNFDEMGRVFLYDDDLDAYTAILEGRDKAKASKPHGHDEQGRPWRFIDSPQAPADGIDPETKRAYRLLPGHREDEQPQS
ncbi:helix-turn-helix domain-containing protein [Streptomyces venezuelae]|uniref:helix-turn-helix domain-containing protein n=1 Tax=Streptomyces venezuelae TaxID=54571 RepID=UPI00343B3B87